MTNGPTHPSARGRLGHAARSRSGSVRDDRIARPISFDAREGEGVDRALVLGGGGVVFVAWLTAYLGELERQGIAVAAADQIVGTSAGSVLATATAAGRLDRFGRLIASSERPPELMDASSPADDS